MVAPAALAPAGVARSTDSFVTRGQQCSSRGGSTFGRYSVLDGRRGPIITAASANNRSGLTAPRRRGSVRARASRGVIAAAGVPPEDVHASSPQQQSGRRGPKAKGSTREVEVVFHLPAWGGEGTAIVVGEHEALGLWDPEKVGDGRATRTQSSNAHSRVRGHRKGEGGGEGRPRTPTWPSP